VSCLCTCYTNTQTDLQGEIPLDPLKKPHGFHPATRQADRSLTRFCVKYFSPGKTPGEKYLTRKR